MKDLYYLRVRGHEKAAVDVLPLKDLRKSPESARLSPVFPLDPSRPYVPPSSFDGFVHFYFQRKPAHTLALLQSQYDGVQSSIKTMVLDHVWYSIGLANIIVFEPEGANLSEVVKFLDGVDGFAAKERWEVSSGALKTSSPTFAPAPPAPDILLKADYSSLPSDIQDSIDECVFCLRSVVRHSWQYLRVEQHTAILNLAGALEENVDSLLKLQGKKDELSVKELLYRHDRLVQLQAALSCMDTQCFSGTIPILAHPAQLRTFSLLGVGSALAGLQNVALFITKTLDAFPVARLHEPPDSYGAGALSAIKVEFDPNANWQKVWVPYDIDGKLQLANKKNSPAPLIYFSARRGFRQSDFCITAPTESLLRGAARKWSIRTLSHEGMHVLENTLLWYMTETSTTYAQNKGDTKAHDPWKHLDTLHVAKEVPTDLSRNTSILLQILIFLKRLEYTTPRFGMIADETEQARLLSAKNLFTIYRHDLEEIMVHVFDRNYFYESNDAYIRSIWNSWSSIPESITRVDDYILRTLVSVGSHLAGSSEHRFKTAVAEVMTAMEHLEASNDVATANLAKSVSSHLKNETSLRAFRHSFMYRIPLADYTQAVLVSTELSKHLHQDASLPDHIDTNKFHIAGLKSPVALLNALAQLDTADDVQVTAWLYLNLLDGSYLA